MEEFNNYFCNMIGIDLSNKNTYNIDIYTTMKTNNKSTLFILPTSIYEIQKEIFN